MKRVLAFLLALVMLFAISACGKEEKKETTKPTEPAKIDNNVVSKDSIVDDNSISNILLVGEDDNNNSDVIMLVSIDNSSNKIKLTSFQRDTYMLVPGHGDSKIKDAYNLGGIELLINTIETNFNIDLEKYVTIDFEQFSNIIDILGGVDMELTNEEIRYINAQIDVNQQSDIPYIKVDNTAETQEVHLNGDQALWHVRNRGVDSLGGVPEYTFEGDDWDRTARQRKLIMAIISELRETTAIEFSDIKSHEESDDAQQLTDEEFVSLVNEIANNMTTNLAKDEVLELVNNRRTYLVYDKAELAVPTEGTWSYEVLDNGQSAIVVNDWTKVRCELYNFIYENYAK